MKVIGIDLDEVLAEFVEGITIFHNERYGTSLSKKDYFSYDFWEVWNCSKEDAVKRVHGFHKTDLFKKLRVCDGAREGIRDLKEKGFKLYIITSRQKAVEKDTREWLENNFPGVFEDVLFSNNFSLENENPLKKSVLCQKVGAQLLVEDQLGYARDCAENGVNVVLLDKPWNKGELPSNIIRVFSWKEVMQHAVKPL